MIILEAEEMWAESAQACSLRYTDCDSEYYQQVRDEFKALRIYDLYGYEYFIKFVTACPHLEYLQRVFIPCKINN